MFFVVCGEEVPLLSFPRDGELVLDVLTEGCVFEVRADCDIRNRPTSEGGGRWMDGWIDRYRWIPGRLFPATSFWKRI